MSADNMNTIYIQKRRNLWWVWMDRPSNEDKHPDWSDTVFETELEAIRYAAGWRRGASIRYKFVILEPLIYSLSNEEIRAELIEDLVYVVDDMELELTIERIRKAGKLLKKLKGLVE